MSLAISDKVNIGDILRLALPLETAVIGASSHARRPVEWIALLTSWEGLSTQVEENDLVIVPLALQPQIKAHLAKLAQLSVAAVLLFQPVTEALEQLAESLNLPLLIVPDGRSIREIHHAIAALLADQQTATRERGMQLYRQLSVMSREDQGLEAMTDLMAKLTGKIVVIQDKRLEIQAMSVAGSTSIDLDDLREALMQREQLPAVLRNRKQAAHIRQSYWQQLLMGEEIGRLISPIISGDRARGYLSIIGPADHLDMLDTLTVENGAAACALEMAKAKAVSEVRKELRGDFLEGLLTGSLPAKEIDRLSRRLDHDTEPPHAVMIFSWDSAEPPSLRRLETAVNWVLSNHPRPALVHIHPQQHVCVFQALKDEKDMETAHDLARRIEEQIVEEFPKTRLVGGMSGPALTLDSWPKVYTEAVQAMQLCQRLNLSHVVEFGSLGVYRLLSALEDNPTVQSFARQIIGPLAEYDEQHRGSLVETVDAFFKHHGNISRTADSLYVHRNTLLYRLERIQELTNHDMDQSDMRLAMHLALKLWQLRPE
ncbi:MAG: helix-turn-helix domain-containing protein [Ardenticatenaceae bacterium]|nr:helix-turn-helix domain-containing protein [Ardenticatenaceae bacterium]